MTSLFKFLILSETRSNHSSEDPAADANVADDDIDIWL